MVARLILVLAIAKLLPVESVGVFGIMLASITYGALVIGMDVYAYSQRKMIGKEINEWGVVIQHQLISHLAGYLILLPLFSLIFIFEIINTKYIFWFYSILVLEHLFQEIYRILVSMNKQILASSIMFISMGLWVLIVIPLMYTYDDLRNLNTILIFWLLGGLFAVSIGGYVIYSAVYKWNVLQLNMSWIKKGYGVGITFLVSSLFFKGLFVVDKYYVEILSDQDILSVYVVYSAIVLGFFNIIEPAVHSFLYPKMIETFQKKDFNGYQVLFKEMIVSSTVISILLFILMYSGSSIIIQWINIDIYTEHAVIFNILMLAGFILSLSQIFHYGLYCTKGDKWIVFANIAAFFIFLTFVFMFKDKDAIYTVSMALIWSFASLLVIKFIGYKRNISSAFIEGRV